MKKLQVAFAALAAVAGVGGAYASTHSNDAARTGTIFNWYTVNGQYRLTGTTATARFQSCKLPGTVICLKGTAGSKKATLFKP
ncbi:hypothetical protein HF324_05350 [Chitinophaga oryzae]|uniref:Uncharacterized protein n=1 Tax=Chitinophaga oryzae TaxID=2725414 RepID=A0ABX6LB26_9BACT|nr:hypothetical protein [Chitinophaga oryzae]QJB37306.1 hypothetical protein HF324_05350 [Chitinophaga oryzae]